MFANMGQQIGGMIQQYGLNKEKRRKEEDTGDGYTCRHESSRTFADRSGKLRNLVRQSKEQLQIKQLRETFN